MRVVFDTVGFVRALINPKVVGDASCSTTQRPIPSSFLDRWSSRSCRVAASGSRAAFQTLPGRDPATILHILQTAETIQLTGIPAVNRDPKDDKVLATAVAGKADYLVSEDRDLLDMERYEGLRSSMRRSLSGCWRRSRQRSLFIVRIR
jgi:predicted nucleic acid-binding protein